MRKTTSTKRIESKLPEFQGVAFVLRRFAEGPRIRMSEALAPKLEALAKLRDEAHEAAGLIRDRLDAIGKMDQAEAIKAASELENTREGRTAFRLARNVELFERNHIWPVYCSVIVKSIEGYLIDDVPATVETLIESGDDALYLELWSHVKREMGLSGDEEKNSESRTTLPARADTQTSSTSADIAESRVSTDIATVPSTTPTE